MQMIDSRALFVEVLQNCVDVRYEIHKRAVIM
jgi:hypothetical protein